MTLTTEKPKMVVVYNDTIPGAGNRISCILGDVETMEAFAKYTSNKEKYAAWVIKLKKYKRI